MNNREWLNTLSDEEYGSTLINYNEQGLRVYCQNISCEDRKCAECFTDWLQQPQEESADEDFAEIGFVVENKQPLYICYADDNGRLLYILKGGNEYDTNNEGWGDELINTVRTIADKKRKEVWGIHEREAEE